MISIERFNKLQAGDLLVLKGSRRSLARKVLKNTGNNGIVVARINRGSIFNQNTTVYLYSDIYKRVTAVLKPKIKSNE